MMMDSHRNLVMDFWSNVGFVSLLLHQGTKKKLPDHHSAQWPCCCCCCFCPMFLDSEPRGPRSAQNTLIRVAFFLWMDDMTLVSDLSPIMLMMISTPPLCYFIYTDDDDGTQRLGLANNSKLRKQD